MVLPPRKKKEDHAYWWAQALSSWSLASVVDCLEFDGNQKSQKLKSLKERQERKFVRRDEYDFENAKVIFVDDTITSGGTAQAAFEALNYPDDFEVWTLVSRPQFGTQ